LPRIGFDNVISGVIGSYPTATTRLCQLKCECAVLLALAKGQCT